MTTNIDKIKNEMREFALRSVRRDLLDGNEIVIYAPSAKMQGILKHLKKSTGKE